jgi:hypothetical protein
MAATRTRRTSLRNEPRDAGHPVADQRTYLVTRTFVVSAQTTDEAQSKVEDLIERGAAEPGDVEVGWPDEP